MVIVHQERTRRRRGVGCYPVQREAMLLDADDHVGLARPVLPAPARAIDSEVIDSSLSPEIESRTEPRAWQHARTTLALRA